MPYDATLCWTFTDNTSTPPTTTAENTEVSLLSDLFADGQSTITWPSPTDPLNQSVSGTVTSITITLDAGGAGAGPAEIGRNIDIATA
jgi:hypothetical protein